MKKTLILLLIVLTNNIYSQENIYSNLYYSCQNCKISNIEKFDKYHILLYRETYSKKDYVFLLDSNNLFIDTLELASASGKIIKISDTEFITTDLNIPTQIKIKNGKLEVSSKQIFPTYRIKDAYNTCDFILDSKYMIGRYAVTINKKRYADLGLTAVDISNATLKEMSKLQKIQYEYIVDRPYYMLDYNKRKLNKHLKTDTIINYRQTMNKRTKAHWIGDTDLRKKYHFYYYGFYTYAFSQTSMFYFDMRTQTLFTIDKNSLKLKSYFSLPVKDPEKNAWKYYYDFDKKKHYFLRMTKEKINSEKKKDIKYTFKFDLFEYIDKELYYRCTVDYIPNAIADESLYKIEPKAKGVEIYKTPISNILTNKIEKLKISKAVNVK